MTQRQQIVTQLFAENAGTNLDAATYRVGDRDVPYPGGLTKRQWLVGPALESRLRAADLPRD